jgi:hypothetical protein
MDKVTTFVIRAKEMANKAANVAEKSATAASQVMGDAVLKTADTLGVKSHVEVTL